MMHQLLAGPDCGLWRLDLKPAEQCLAESLLVELRAFGPLQLLDPELDQVLEDRLVVIGTGGLERPQRG